MEHNRELQRVSARILALCWADPQFKGRFRQEPARIFEEHGYTAAEGERLTAESELVKMILEEAERYSPPLLSMPSVSSPAYYPESSDASPSGQPQPQRSFPPAAPGMRTEMQALHQPPWLSTSVHAPGFAEGHGPGFAGGYAPGFAGGHAPAFAGGNAPGVAGGHAPGSAGGTGYTAFYPLLASPFGSAAVYTVVAMDPRLAAPAYNCIYGGPQPGGWGGWNAAPYAWAGYWGVSPYPFPPGVAIPPMYAYETATRSWQGSEPHQVPPMCAHSVPPMGDAPIPPMCAASMPQMCGDSPANAGAWTGNAAPSMSVDMPPVSIRAMSASDQSVPPMRPAAAGQRGVFGAPAKPSHSPHENS